MKTDIVYDGEFGAELQLIIPYAYYLHKNNLLGKTTSSLDTGCFYCFSKDHHEQFTERRYCSPKKRAEQGIPNIDEHVSELETSQWVAPPYKDIYKNNRFVWEKETIIISNKFCTEWDERPYNYISLPVLEKILLMLKDKYQIIYWRPEKEHIATDQNQIESLGDFDLISRYPEVLTLRQLQENNRDLSFNRLQMKVFANCEHFISVQGGNSVLASYFGGTNIIYTKKGRELLTGDYRHFHLFSGSAIMPCLNYSDMLQCIQTVFLPASSLGRRTCKQKIIKKWYFEKYNLITQKNMLVEYLRKIRAFFKRNKKGLNSQ